MMLPAEWHAENDDDVIRILDQDDVGEIQVTTLHKQSGKIDSGEVSAMARQESPEDFNVGGGQTRRVFGCDWGLYRGQCCYS